MGEVTGLSCTVVIIWQPGDRADSISIVQGLMRTKKDLLLLGIGMVDKDSRQGVV